MGFWVFFFFFFEKITFSRTRTKMRYILLPFKCSPFNRVALFTAQITRESLDGQGESGTAAGVTKRRGEAPILRPPLLILALGD